MYSISKCPWVANGVTPSPVHSDGEQRRSEASTMPPVSLQRRTQLQPPLTLVFTLPEEHDFEDSLCGRVEHRPVDARLRAAELPGAVDLRVEDVDFPQVEIFRLDLEDALEETSGLPGVRVLVELGGSVEALELDVLPELPRLIPTQPLGS